MKRIILILAIALTLQSCTKQNTLNPQNPNMPTSNGTAVFHSTFPEASTFNQVIVFTVQQQPTIMPITQDPTLCSVSVIGDDIYVTFPTYPIPANESISTTILVYNYDTTGVNNGMRTITAFNVVPSDTL